MRIRNLFANLSIAALLAGTGCLSGEPMSVGEIEEQLYQANVTLWTANGNNVPICWIDSGWAAEKAVMQAAINASWPKESALTVTWEASCPSDWGARRVRIKINPQAKDKTGVYPNQGGDGSAWIGMDAAFRSALAGPSITYWLRPDHLATTGRLQYLAVHELGHVLGFNHEQDRPENGAGTFCADGLDPDATGIALGRYDQDSIMNYCNSDGNAAGNLTPTDVLGLRAVYGAPETAEPVAHSYFAPAGEIPMTGDFNGDGREDIVTFTYKATNAKVYVALSNGKTYGASSQWHANFCSSAVTSNPDRCQVGDFNGDGRDDLLSFSPINGTVKVALSTGTGFGAAQTWKTGFCNGQEICDVGDFNGDGRDDVVAFARDTKTGDGRGDVWVALSTGTKLAATNAWHGIFCIGQETCEVGDFNGDGRDDVVAFVRSTQTGAGAGDVWVGWSNGNAFTTSPRTHDSFCLGADSCKTGDVDGDGCDDLLSFTRGTNLGDRVGDVHVARMACDGAVRVDRTFRWHQYFCPGGETCDVGDLDGDGADSLVSFARTAAKVFVDDAGRP